MKYLLSGFLVKIITGLDDTLVHIPIVANLTRTKLGRIAFAFGIFIAISLAIIISFLFASTIKLFPYSKHISATLIFLLAIVIYFDIFIHHPQKEVEKKLKKIKRISAKRFARLFGIGFIVAFVTVIDDIIAYSALFLGQLSNVFPVIIGIFSATLFELVVIIHFSKKITAFKWKKEIATFGLIILGLLIWFGVL